MVCATGTPGEDGLLIGAGFDRAGYAVEYFDFENRAETELDSVVRHSKFDIVFVTKGQGIHRRTYDSIKPHVGKLVLWYPDAYLPEDTGYGVEFLSEVLPAFDVVLACYRGLVGPLSKHNPDCHFAPSYFDNIFYAVDSITPGEREYFASDCVFIGNNQKVYGHERLDVLRKVSRLCELKVWGTGWGVPVPHLLAHVAKLGSKASLPPTSIRTRLWTRFQIAPPVIRWTKISRSIMSSQLVGDAVSKAYMCSKIGLNAGTFHGLKHGEIDLGFSDRLFKCMGNSTPYLTPPIRNIEEWFDPGKDIAIYHTYRELTEWIRYLLENAEERILMARNGYTKVMKHHTVDTRIRQYLTLIEGGACPFD